MRGAIMMAAVAAALSTGPAEAVTPEDFTDVTSGKLASLCSTDPSDALHAEARNFCYGYIAGAANFHALAVRGGELRPVACPDRVVSRDEVIQTFLAWAEDNAAYASETAVGGLSRAAASKWPCP